MTALHFMLGLIAGTVFGFSCWATHYTKEPWLVVGVVVVAAAAIVSGVHYYKGF